MYYTKTTCLQLTIIILCLFILTCNNAGAVKEGELVKNPIQMDATATENIKDLLEKAFKENGKIDDTIRLNLVAIVNDFYSKNDFKPIWSSEEQWQPLADSLLNLINHAEAEGLFPKDYHQKNLNSLKHKLDSDSAKRMDAALWTRADLMFTDAFMRLVKDYKFGRLKADSISLNPDSILSNEFFSMQLATLIEKKQFTALMNSLQPAHIEYWNLKKGIKRFTDSMDRHTYTYVSYPFKKDDIADSLKFIKIFQKRLFESGAISFTNTLPDSAQLSVAVKKYQKQKGLKSDGKVSSYLLRIMNTSDTERFKRIAITLDRYKHLPAKMPELYIWVNLPAYSLKLVQHDTVVLESRVICGKPDTRTPVLNSEISNMVTFPTWTVPNSIIVKQYLPKLKTNPGYLARLGLHLENRKGKTIDANKVNWSKYTVGIPYKVMQGSGNDNALGVFKFNFNNPYAVYLHDTNQRYLFKNSSRGFSHGCVRVQEWKKLAYFIARNDSINLPLQDTLTYNTDSIDNWIAAKQNHQITVKNKIPIYIRYFGCEIKEGKIKFYEDIYGEDKALREKYFTDK
jgi:murein L,D-transpeptidase YcbB/YkuD